MSTCPICHVAIGGDRIFCPKDWFKVPKPLRDEIWRLFRSEPGSVRHRRAVLESVRLVSEKESSRVAKQLARQPVTLSLPLDSTDDLRGVAEGRKPLPPGARVKRGGR